MAMHPVLSEIRSIETTGTAIRSFGRIIVLALIAIAVFQSWTIGWGITRSIVLIVTAGILVCALAYLLPGTLRPVYLVWMSIALVLGHLMTRVLLTLVFFLVVTPIGVIMRSIGKDPLKRTPDRSLGTYWLKRDDSESMGDRMTRYY